MASSLGKVIHHADHGAGARGGIRSGVARLFTGNRWITRMLFRMRVDRARPDHGYFNLTTVLLKRELKRRVRRYLYPRLLEVGIGRFAILSGYLSRRVRHRVVACDYDEAAVVSAAKHVDENGLNVEVLRSDVLGSIPVNEYDLIYSNLPDSEDPKPVLTRLLSTVTDYLSGNARLIVGFTSRQLSFEVALAILARFPALTLDTARRSWWNRRIVLVICRA